MLTPTGLPAVAAGLAVWRRCILSSCPRAKRSHCQAGLPEAHNLQAIHNRMPVILEPEAEDVWLNPDVTDLKELTPLLHPYEVKALDMYPVSKAVNRAAHDSPEFIQKIDS